MRIVLIKLFLFILVPCSLFLVPAFSIAQQTVGVFEHTEDASEGYNLFAPISSTRTYLIDNCGRYINSWTSNLRPGMSAYLLENGDMIRAGRITSSFNNGGTGGRIERYNWEGDLIWQITYSSGTYHQHHDFEVLPNGNVLILAWEKISKDDAVDNGRDPGTVGNNSGLWPEHVVEVEPEGSEGGNIVWEWHLKDHLIQDFDPSKANFGVVADHPELVNINFAASIGGGGGGGGADWVHANSIDYNPQLDQIVISSRTFNEFWIIDHSTTAQEAAGHTGGNSGRGGDLLYRWGNPQTYDRGTPADQQLYGQHDVSWIPQGYPDEGKLILFNNGSGRPGGNHSSIEVIDPPMDNNENYIIEDDNPFGPATPSWTYKSDPVNEFYSSNISGVQRLPNGNTLICEGNSGEFIEVNQNSSVQWRYVNPVTNVGPVNQGQNAIQNNTFRVYRYGPDYEAFTDKNLMPGEPLEGDPLPTVCILDDSVSVANTEIFLEKEVTIFPNPATDFISIDHPADKQIESVQLLDLTGREVKEVENGNLGEVHSGLFLVRIRFQNGQFVTKRLVITRN